MTQTMERLRSNQRWQEVTATWRWSSEPESSIRSWTRGAGPCRAKDRDRETQPCWRCHPRQSNRRSTPVLPYSCRPAPPPPRQCLSCVELGVTRSCSTQLAGVNRSPNTHTACDMKQGKDEEGAQSKQARNQYKVTFQRLVPNSTGAREKNPPEKQPRKQAEETKCLSLKHHISHTHVFRCNWYLLLV